MNHVEKGCFKFILVTTVAYVILYNNVDIPQPEKPHQCRFITSATDQLGRHLCTWEDMVTHVTIYTSCEQYDYKNYKFQMKYQGFYAKPCPTVYPKLTNVQHFTQLILTVIFWLNTFLFGMFATSYFGLGRMF